MYHAGWAWAGSTPYKGTELQGSYFGGIRQPMAIAWPRRIKADPKPRSQFHHFIDIVPTVYDAAKITAPRIVGGIEQDAIAGVSMAYTFADAAAPSAEGPSSSTSSEAGASTTTVGSRAHRDYESRG
jgi:arylsulfatase